MFKLYQRKPNKSEDDPSESQKNRSNSLFKSITSKSELISPRSSEAFERAAENRRNMMKKEFRRKSGKRGKGKMRRLKMNRQKK